MHAPWDSDQTGVLVLPSGRTVRGRGLRAGIPAGPTFALYFSTTPPEPVSWEARWIYWRDFWVPADPTAADAALVEAWSRATTERVEVACTGGQGRTGTALACLAVLDGMSPADAIRYVRAHYRPRAVETPWQRRYVRRFARQRPRS